MKRRAMNCPEFHAFATSLRKQNQLLFVESVEAVVLAVLLVCVQWRWLRLLPVVCSMSHELALLEASLAPDASVPELAQPANSNSEAATLNNEEIVLCLIEMQSFSFVVQLHAQNGTSYLSSE